MDIKSIKVMLKHLFTLSWLTVCLVPAKIMAITNPWASATPVTPDNLQTTVDSKMSTSLEVMLIGGGVALLISGIMVFISLLNKSADDKKDDGAFKTIMMMLTAIFCVIIGLVFVGMGYGGATAIGTG